MTYFNCMYYIIFVAEIFHPTKLNETGMAGTD